MQVEIDLKKSVDENAGRYYDKAKKLKKKLEGARETVDRYKAQLNELESKQEMYEQQESEKEKKKATRVANVKWYHKYHWFVSSEGLVCVGGRDATQNEILVKKHMEKNDYVLHTDMAGSPFFLVKEGQVNGTEVSVEECAQAVACPSRAWKEGLGTVDVFYVKPEQVSKEAQAGENLPKGAFMVRGETKYFHPELKFAFAKNVVKEDEGETSDQDNSDDSEESEIIEELVWGPLSCLEARFGLSELVVVVPGREKKSVLAKSVLHKLKVGLIDEIVAAMPAGGGDIKGMKSKKGFGKRRTKGGKKKK